MLIVKRLVKYIKRHIIKQLLECLHNDVKRWPRSVTIKELSEVLVAKLLKGLTGFILIKVRSELNQHVELAKHLN